MSRMAIYQQKLRYYHIKKIKPLSLGEGDLVLIRIQRTTGQYKLSSPWEGPFIINREFHNNAYYLIDAEKPRKRKRDDTGQETERPWNAALLRPFYC